jgi:hypothetical protein
VERIIIFDDKNVVRFLIYKSMVERYLSRIATDPALLRSGVAIVDLTPKPLLDSDPQTRVVFETSFRFVRVDATLADAKQVMDKTSKGQDVFVTQTGDSKKPIIGWVTDNVILENAKV